MKTRILKFGGTSVGTPERVEAVMEIIRSAKKEDLRLCVVISAFSGITDLLIDMSNVASQGQEEYRRMYQNLVTKHYQFTISLLNERQEAVLQHINQRLEILKDVLHGVYLLKELSPKTLDYIMSFGEWFSCTIISEALLERGVRAEFVDARPLVRTDRQFGTARVDFASTNRLIREYFHKSGQEIHIITGFCGSSEKGETTTLGRSGSDYTAAIFGAALDADEIQIWTDVDGVMTADPRKVPDAFPLAELSYEEAMEMSHFGARVIHPPTMQPAMSKNIPIRILNTFNPEFPGTFIRTQTDGEIAEESSDARGMIKGVSSISNVALLRLEGSGMVGAAGISMRMFAALAREGINIILISQASSEHSICFAVAPGDAHRARALIEAEFELEIAANRVNPPVLEENLSIIAIVGENMRHTPGIAGRLFQALGRNGINVIAIAQGSSELNISVVIQNVDEAKALNAVHEAFFLSETRRLHVFLVGVGLVGGTLLKQIHAHRDFLKRERSLDIRVVALANSRQCLFDANGIDLQDWPGALKKSPAKMNLEAFVQQMFDLNLPGSVFVDCTAASELVDVYEKILCHNISIVAPNKKSVSDSYAVYQRLRKAATRPGATFLYETNVGAGLPVISTLRDLISSGDQILKIEAVLSGTLSYIFNNFDGSAPFSVVVRTAMEKGYTEPDPRDDLNGLDVARKLLILARETGLPLEMADIELENLVPESCRTAASVEAFFEKLQQADPVFEKKRRGAANENQRLRYIATLQQGRARVRLVAVGADHPFYDLSGSDNIISFTTDRYRERPLVVKGPGAGAEVTAAGVFADIVRISN